MIVLTRRKKIVFALVTMALVFVATGVLLLIADLILHKRAEKSAGLNRYGYRGPVIGRKQPNELRVAMLGGSTVFGYGVAWNESIPAFLEPKLQAQLGRPVTVVNLGYNNEGAYSFQPNLEDFAYLDYDVIVLYEGYNDLAGDSTPNLNVYRRGSAMFRTFGYFPILPLYLEEKARSWRFGGLEAAYQEARNESPGKVVFQPGLAKRTGAAALQAISSITTALDGQLEGSGVVVKMTESDSTTGCSTPYVIYCESVAGAVRYGLARGKGVVVGSQPRAMGQGLAHERQARQQAALAAMMQRNFGQEPRVAWADVSPLVDLTSVDATFDGMHLKPEANAAVAAALVEPVSKVAAAARR